MERHKHYAVVKKKEKEKKDKKKKDRLLSLEIYKFTDQMTIYSIGWNTSYGHKQYIVPLLLWVKLKICLKMATRMLKE